MRHSFSHSRRRKATLVAVGLLLPLMGVRAHAEDPLEPVLGEAAITLPNLVPNVEYVAIQRFFFDEATQTVVVDKPYLYFDTRAQNLGTVPVQLQLTDVPNLEDMASAPVSQCVSWVERVCRKQESVGGFVWHDPHKHWHYEEFASYQLRRVGADGRPDYSPAGLVALSEKVSFCFVDSEGVDSADSDEVGIYRQCTPTLQGISPGWTDIYDAGMPGQQFPLEGLADGRYAVVIDMDYANRLHETSDDDNYVEVTVEISGGLTEVSVVDRRWPAPADRGTPTTTTEKKRKKDKDG